MKPTFRGSRKRSARSAYDKAKAAFDAKVRVDPADTQAEAKALGVAMTELLRADDVSVRR